MNRGANCRIFQLLIQYGSCYCLFLFSVLCDLLFFHGSKSQEMRHSGNPCSHSLRQGLGR